jgi:hypothetical protein
MMFTFFKFLGYFRPLQDAFRVQGANGQGTGYMHLTTIRNVWAGALFLESRFYECVDDKFYLGSKDKERAINVYKIISYESALSALVKLP